MFVYLDGARASLQLRHLHRGDYNQLNKSVGDYKWQWTNVAYGVYGFNRSLIVFWIFNSLLSWGNFV